MVTICSYVVTMRVYEVSSTTNFECRCVYQVFRREKVVGGSLHHVFVTHGLCPIVGGIVVGQAHYNSREPQTIRKCMNHFFLFIPSLPFFKSISRLVVPSLLKTSITTVRKVIENIAIHKIRVKVISIYNLFYYKDR